MASMPLKTGSMPANTQLVRDRQWARDMINEYGAPGLRAANPIPPSDSPEYRLFQLELGLAPDQFISKYRGKK